MAIFTTFGKQKDDKSTLFPGGVSVKFWIDLLGLAKGKGTLHQHTTAYNTLCLGTAYILWIFGVEEWSFEVEWSQILCSLVGFTKTNTELFLLQHITTLTSIQARIIFIKDISCFHSTELSKRM